MKYPCFPLWKWAYLGWIIPGLLVTTILVLVLCFGKNLDATQLIISTVSCSSIFAICTIGFITQLVLRYKIIKDILYTISINNESEILIFRKSKGIEDLERLWKVMIPVPGIKTNINNNIEKLKKVAPRANTKYFSPHVFVTFKKPGTIKTERFGKVFRHYGIQKGRWCEVEWGGNIDKTLNLLLHELEHAVLSFAYPKWDVEKQHRIMKEREKNV